MRPDQVETLTRHAGRMRHVLEQISMAMHPHASQERVEELLFDLVADADQFRSTVERCREVFRDVYNDRHNNGGK